MFTPEQWSEVEEKFCVRADNNNETVMMIEPQIRMCLVCLRITTFAVATIECSNGQWIQRKWCFDGNHGTIHEPLRKWGR
jgi:hypothetical protein